MLHSLLCIILLFVPDDQGWSRFFQTLEIDKTSCVCLMPNVLWDFLDEVFGSYVALWLPLVWHIWFTIQHCCQLCSFLELPGVNEEDDDSDNEDDTVEQVAVEGDCFC